jgi:hypothetical protein
MQTEAGQPLEDIFRRKELERQSGNGIFFWGVGNPPARITSELARSRHPVTAIFSIMKSKPKGEDVAPSRTVLWQTFIDKDGNKQSIPENVLVTSRADTNKGTKKYHYALMCYSPTPLSVERGNPFDPTAYRNIGEGGKPVGASQVTALLQRVEKERSDSSYEVNLSVALHGSYWVRLEDPLVIHPDDVLLATECKNQLQWVAAVKKLRSLGRPSAGNAAAQLDFLL